VGKVTALDSLEDIVQLAMFDGGYIGACTGDGMAIALYSGIAAAQAVLTGEDAAAFQRRIIERVRPQPRWC